MHDYRVQQRTEDVAMAEAAVPIDRKRRVIGCLVVEIEKA
jgi:hypothetical protein